MCIEARSASQKPSARRLSRCSELDAANKLFRLCSEPRRLWRRYAYAVPGFALLAFGEFLHRAIGSSGGRLLPEAGKRHLGGTRNVELGFERPPADHGKTTGQIAGYAARAKLHRCTG
jgi:hypothetical protein